MIKDCSEGIVTIKCKTFKPKLIESSNSKIFSKTILINVYTFNMLPYTTKFSLGTIVLISGILIISSSVFSTARAQNGMDELITQLKNDGDGLKAEIASTNLFKTGLVEGLISKVYYYEGRVTAWDGGTWAYLHDVQDALIAKINATGQEGFTMSEQISIDSFATHATQSKIDHPTANVFE
ncbi:MAG: hypothetical protein AB7V56_03930 [Candidatus Nitrosocosmicus sp.]